MATVTNYELDFNFKSEDDLKIILEKLNDFLTYDYIGENCYKVEKLNLKMDISYLSNEDESSFEVFFPDSFNRGTGMDSGYDVLCEDLIDIIDLKKGSQKTQSENIRSKRLSRILNKKIVSHDKYLQMMNILDMLDTFSIKFWDYYGDEGGEIIESKRKYFNVITKENYK